uniref:Extensin-like n=1 Tax=Cicer arietinum TaxID=3827 RepID=A0A1S3E3Z0_CICAR|nr:extensin-like [Cicer arietinum]
MARTKQSARKNAYPCSPSSSSPSSESIQRSPSPPPRPTPPHVSSDTSFSNYLSSSLENNPNIPINPNPLSTVLPPLYTCPPPNLAQVPPHLRKPTIPKRHSMRIQSGIGTSKASSEKPFYLIISDFETNDSSDTPLHTTAIEKAQNKPITPSKSSFSSEPSQSTPPNQKRRLINEIISSL